MRKLYLAMGLALVAMLVAAGAVYAAVNFDSSTGTGFVGKGDVQVLYNLNNTQMQKILIANPQAFTFSYNDTATYTATCTWITGAGTRGEQTHDVDIPRHTGINSAINGDPRKTSGQKQFTGFNLTGKGDVTTTGTVPVVGDPCVGNDPDGTAHNGTWSAVSDPVYSGGMLYVTYGGVSKPLPNTPIV